MNLETELRKDYPLSRYCKPINQRIIDTSIDVTSIELDLLDDIEVKLLKDGIPLACGKYGSHDYVTDAEGVSALYQEIRSSVMSDYYVIERTDDGKIVMVFVDRFKDMESAYPYQIELTEVN